ncbi:hypothetical protein Golax_019081 [Gossypium laxum]|uniref:Uncharacterized protein n=1 Tax=Gossypium laxum TaxID=34288 RepID=A0A7J8Z6Z7_9ROSI|nr:hypothetical protein [Gossypium laxum]
MIQLYQTEMIFLHSFRLEFQSQKLALQCFKNHAKRGRMDCTIYKTWSWPIDVDVKNSFDYAVLGGSSKIAAILVTYPFQVCILIIGVKSLYNLIFSPLAGHGAL